MNPILAAAVNTGDISEAAVYQEEDSVESDVAKDDDADTQTGDPGSTAEGDGTLQSLVSSEESWDGLISTEL